MSQPGKGTTALIWLPISKQKLVVRAGTADMLKEEGYEVTHVSSGYEALRLLQDGLPAEVMITDFAMPGMTGVDLAREAVALRPELQVLLITGYANVSDREAAGLIRLEKPFRQADLAGTLADLVKRKKVVSFSPELASKRLHNQRN